MKSYVRWLIAAAVIAGGGVVFLRGEKSSAEPKAIAQQAAQAIAKVKLVDARPADSVAGEALTGTLLPAKQLQVGFEVGGRLTKVFVHKGQTLKQGELLGELATDIADAQVDAANAAVLAAQAQADNAEDVAGRMSRLKGSGAVTEMQDRGAVSTAAAAKAQLAAAKAQLAQARAARARCELHAPFAGTVIDSPEQIGATVAPGMPLFTLEQLDTLRLSITVSETDSRSLRVGQKVAVDAIGTGEHSAEANVRVIVPSADPATHRIPVELSVPNANGNFTAHTLARATLPSAVASNAQAIPATALAMIGGEHVLTLENGIVQRVDVDVLSRSSDAVIVRAKSPLAQVIDAPAEDLAIGAHATP